MQDIDDDELSRMSLRELLEFQKQIQDAIRAQIRLKNARMAAAAGLRQLGAVHLPRVEQSRQRSLSVYAAIHRAADVVAVSIAPPEASKQQSSGVEAIGLERERDAWLTRKRTKASE